MYVAITCCIMTCSISKGFVTYHGSMKCEINYNYNYNYNYKCGVGEESQHLLECAGNIVH